MHYLEPHRPPPAFRTVQIIVGALIAGLAVFVAVAALAPAQVAAPNLGPVRQVATMVVVVSIPTAIVLRHLILRRAIGADSTVDESARLMQFQTATIVGCALLEGPALFAAVIFLLGRDPADLWLAAIPVVVMAFGFFPTAGRWDKFMRAGSTEVH